HQRHHPGRIDARQNPDDRRSGLCQGQSGNAGALVWRGARDRVDPRGRENLGRADPRPGGRQRARGRHDPARPTTPRERLSYQGMRQARGEEILIAWRALSLRIATLSALTGALVAPASAATEVERVVSPLGIEAWLVHSPTAPLIAIDFAFRGGSSQDPAD